MRDGKLCLSANHKVGSGGGSWHNRMQQDAQPPLLGRTGLKDFPLCMFPVRNYAQMLPVWDFEKCEAANRKQLAVPCPQACFFF